MFRIIDNKGLKLYNPIVKLNMRGVVFVRKKSSENKKMLPIIIVLIVITIIVAVAGVVIFKSLKAKPQDENINKEALLKEDVNEENVPKEKVDIIDINSKTRPYAIVVNNTPIAVKVQEGLNNAYVVYEIPTEGNTSRLLALFKDAPETLEIGTVRSARHDFVDFALESDAIYCCYGWSHYAEDDLKSGSIDYLQGLLGGPYYRNNPEGLASEHTVYTSIEKLNSAVKSQGMRSTSDNSVLLNYDVSDIDLSSIDNKQVANSVVITYGTASNTSKFMYNPETKMYTRYSAENKCVDYTTKEDITTKNIIVQKINYDKCDDNYYWDLYTVSSGEGYYITNGYALPIEWSKSNRKSKTKFIYKSGTVIDGKDVSVQEISVSDGRTWIEVQVTSQKLTIE